MTVGEIRQIITDKVIGVWEPMHDEYGHKYRNTKTGHIQKSVTTKLQVMEKKHLLPWAVKMAAQWLMQDNRAMQLLNPNATEAMIQGMQMAHMDIRDDAGGVGSVAHAGAERWLNEWIASGFMPEDIKTFLPPVCDPRSVASARAIQAWFVKSGVTPIASEILVGDIRYSAGTLDLLYLDQKGKLCLGDFKTSNSIDKDGYSMQVAAYKNFFEQMTGLKVHKCIIIHLSKDYDKFDVYNVKNIPNAWKAFKNICQVFDWKYNNKEKVEKDIKRISI